MARWRGDVRPAKSVAVTDVDLHDAARVCDRDPVGSVLAASRIEAAIAGGAVGGGATVWGHQRDGVLTSLCWAGANLVPVCAAGDEEALDVFADAALREGRRCSSIVGDADAVLGLWRRLERSWGPAREVRADQPSMVIDRRPAVEPDPLVGLSSPDEMDVLLPACVAMFEEEVGYSPLGGSPGAYEARVRTLVEEGRSYRRMETTAAGREIVFKAELGAVSSTVAQVQGVWVPPSRRRQGLAEHGMAAVVAHALNYAAPVVSLYVNHYNAPALAAYRRVGFRQVGSYATVLF